RALGGGKAIGLLKENFYDIIFIDHKMSKINGLDAAKIIRAMPGEYYKTVPLVFCTDEKMDNIYKDFLEAGFSDYLLYPISVKHLSLVLTRWVWKKLEKQEALRKEEEVWDGNHREIEVLLNDSLMFYEKKNMMLFSFCIRGIKQMSMIIGSSNAEELAREAGNAILFEDMDMLEETYMELVKVLKALLKENGEA
ncbi:MAG TPA: response regulator, partial [Lachnospiraceae bacterium]|nr:response regulator [Lachnospiraceae bacterium]